MGGKNRRQARLEQRRAQPSTPPASRPAAKAKPAWRHTLDQWGGPWVLAVAVAVLAFIGWIAWANRPVTVSTGDLMGEAVQTGRSDHVKLPSELQIPAGLPPAGGPHYENPQPGGVYKDPVDDGRAIHSLEHGLIWITYRPGGLSDEELKALTELVDGRKRDVILSPRPDNKDALVVVSWQRRLVAKPGDTETIRKFISSNLNRSPEPAVR